jgi:hypothetical protein
VLDDTLTPYEFAMEDVNEALLKIARALTADDPDVTAQECSEVRLAYRRIKHLCPKLRLDPAQRDSLFGQLSLLETRLAECERSIDRFAALHSSS